MQKTCLKCGLAAEVADSVDAECPRCGAIYARVEANLASPAKVMRTPKPSYGRIMAMIGGAVVVGIALVWAATQQRPAYKAVQVQSTATTASTVSLDVSESVDTTAASIAEVKRRDTAWRDATNLAARTSRIQLAPVVQDLQKQLRENEALEVAKCLQPGKTYWIESQRLVVEGMLAFMSRDEDESQEKLDESIRARRNFTAVLEACSSSP